MLPNSLNFIIIRESVLMLKQIITGFAVASVLMSSLASLPVSAATNLNVSINDTSAKVSENFTTKIAITDIPNTGISVMDFAVKFDTDVVKSDCYHHYNISLSCNKRCNER